MRAGVPFLVAVSILATAGLAMAAPPLVTVEGKPPPSATLNHETYDFVGKITVQPDGESLIRWAAPICPYAVGLSPEQNAAIAQEVALAANAAGAPVATTDCHPNFVVVATGQPEALLAAWRKRDPGMFGDALPSAVDRFLTKAQPVRVWYNALRASSDGEVIARGPPVYSGLPTLDSFTLSRLRFQTVLGLQSAIVVVDLNRTEGLSIGQLADYAAMAGLTELKLDADVGDAPTILRLFRVPPTERPVGLTDWDKGFLAGIYASDQSSRVQRSAIAASVSAAAARPASP